MSAPEIRGAVCKRCDNPFRFIKRPIGRPRLYCEPCQQLERIDNARVQYAAKRAARAA